MKMNRSKFARFFTILSFVMIAVVFLATPVLAMAENAPVTQSEEITPEGFADILLGIVGVALSLAFKYVPNLKTWFDGFEKKGLLMLGFVVITGGVYFALSCTPYAESIGIQFSCESSSIFLLIRSIGVIATGNQLAHLFSPKPATQAAKV